MNIPVIFSAICLTLILGANSFKEKKTLTVSWIENGVNVTEKMVANNYEEKFHRHIEQYGVIHDFQKEKTFIMANGSCYTADLIKRGLYSPERMASAISRRATIPSDLPMRHLVFHATSETERYSRGFKRDAGGGCEGQPFTKLNPMHNGQSHPKGELIMFVMHEYSTFTTYHIYVPKQNETYSQNNN